MCEPNPCHFRLCIYRGLLFNFESQEGISLLDLLNQDSDLCDYITILLFIYTRMFVLILYAKRSDVLPSVIFLPL